MHCVVAKPLRPFGRPASGRFGQCLLAGAIAGHYLATTTSVAGWFAMAPPDRNAVLPMLKILLQEKL
jgi:hypothetical protein